MGVTFQIFMAPPIDAICPNLHLLLAQFVQNTPGPKARGEKKKKLFYRWKDLPSRVGRWGIFLFFSFFFFLGAKLILKYENFKTFLQKNFGENIFYFQKFSPKIFSFGQKIADFTRFWNSRGKMPKRKIWVGRACKTGFYFLGLYRTYMRFIWKITPFSCRVVK